MELAPLLILPLVGGYAFAIIWGVSSFHAAREAGHRLYFRAVFYAVFLLILAALVHISLLPQQQWYGELVRALAAIGGRASSPLPQWGEDDLLAIFWGAFVLGPALAGCLNLVARIPDVRRWILGHSIASNDLEKMLAYSAFEQAALMFSMDDRKVYIGMVVHAPNPSASRKAVRIQPIASGYRDPVTLRFEMTTDYAQVYEGLPAGESPEAFQTVLLVDRLMYVHPFNFDRYDAFHGGDDAGQADAAEVLEATEDEDAGMTTG